MHQALMGGEEYRRRDVAGAGSLAWLLGASTVWVVAYALELSTADLGTKLLATRVQYLGAIGAPLAWLAFSVRYAGHLRWFTVRMRIVLTAFPALWVVLAWTNDLHGWFWSDASLSADGGLVLTHGPVYWVYVSFAYSYLLAGSLMLLVTLRRVPRAYRAQGWCLGLAVAIPWLSNAVYLSGYVPIPHLDPTPFALAVATLLLGWSMLRLNLLRFHVGLIPLARDAIVAGMADGVLVIDAQGRLLDLNPAAADALGEAGHPAIGESIETVLGVAVTNLDTAGTTRVELPSPDGRAPRYFDLRVSALAGTGRGGRANQLIVLRDVTDRHYAELALSESERRYRTVVDTVSEVIFQTDRAGRWRLLNPAWTSITGYEVAESLGTWVTTAMEPADRALHRAEFAALADGTQSDACYVVRFLTRDGLVRWLQVHARPERTESGAFAGVTGTLTDITERKSLEEQLTYQAFHDPLTGLANRVLFAERVGHALTRSTRHPALHAVLFLDVDHFKNVNDSLGHGEGDHLLKVIADRLRNRLRETDTVARLGGDEFAVLVEDLGNPAEAWDSAQRLLESVREPIRLAEAEIFVTVSIGIATAGAGTIDGSVGNGIGDSDPCDVASLIQRADIALYQSKRSGRNRATAFAASMATPVRERLQLEAELHRAIERDELVVHYQPMVELAEQRICGVEALVRWIHPTRGLIRPPDFIALAEDTGLIIPLGRWVLERACRQVRAWNRFRLTESPLTLSVNLSARQFQHPALVEEMREVLAQTELPPESLLLEITESVVMQDTAATLATLQELKALGVRLAIDDFGTGYSSLSYLQRFPIDFLKIDRAFVAGVERGGEEGAFAQTMIQLARALRLKTVAEGIELPEQVASLQQLGCDLGQGYYFSRPLAADAVTDWLRAASIAGRPGPPRGPDSAAAPVTDTRERVGQLR